MKRKVIFASAGIVGVVLLGGFGFAWAYRASINHMRVLFENSENEKITLLQKQISALEEKVNMAANLKTSVTVPTQEVTQRATIRERSQEDELTGAVARVTPTVVSIVISKDVPQLEVSYENPFGNDPFFKDFGYRIPVYRQKGVTRQKVGAGTGFLVSADGYIVTNRHVVVDTTADYTVLLSDGSQKPATVMYKDAKNDVALVKIAGGNYPHVTLGNSDTLKLGQTVVAIGNALGEYNNSVSLGVVSGLNRTIQAQTEKLEGVIQTDAAINPGNSGGPLLNLSGDIVGVNVATVIGSNSISFAIPINVVKSIIQLVAK